MTAISSGICWATVNGSSAVPVGDHIELRATNDALALAVTVRAMAVAMDGQTRALAEATVQVGDAAVMALRVHQADLGPQEMLAYVWADGAKMISGDVFAPKPYKHYDLLPPHLSHHVTEKDGSYSISVSAQALALFVALEADQPGCFSVNSFTLFPGHPATVTFTPTHPGAAPRFILRDLHSATYGPTA